MKEMYKGMVNSPQTKLSKAINSADTDIYVKDGSVFPTGPNLAVIGIDQHAETILYSSVSNNILVGCTRGYQGEARAWDAEIPIARNFTEADLDAVQENIKALEKAMPKKVSELDNDMEYLGKYNNPFFDREDKPMNITTSWRDVGFKKGWTLCTSANVPDAPNGKGKYVVYTGFDAEIDETGKPTKLMPPIIQLAYEPVNDKWYRRYGEPKGGNSDFKDENCIAISPNWDGWVSTLNFSWSREDILEIVSDSRALQPRIVDSLPNTGENNRIYLLKDTKGKGNNNYLEYLWIDNKWELIGPTQVDLSEYLKKSDVFDNKTFDGDTEKLRNIPFSAQQGIWMWNTLDRIAPDGFIDPGKITPKISIEDREPYWNNDLQGILLSGALNELFLRTTKLNERKADKSAIKDVSRSKTKGYSSASAWSDVSSSRDVEDWIGDFDKRTRENKKAISNVAKIVVLTESEYRALSNKDQNTIYFVR